MCWTQKKGGAYIGVYVGGGVVFSPSIAEIFLVTWNGFFFHSFYVGGVGG